MTGIIEFKSDTLNVEVSGVDNNLTNLIEVIPSKSDVIVNVDNASSSLYVNNVEVSGANNGTVNIVEIIPDDQDVYINVQDTSAIVPDLSNYYTRDNPSGFITGINVDLSNYATVNNLFLTGSGLQSQINNLDLNYTSQIEFDALSGNLISTGSILYTQINNLSGVSVLTYGDQIISGLKNFITRPTVNGIPIALSGEPASSIEQYVKNDEGQIIYKGQPVYVKGSNGNNILIALASNTGESSSSKTFGLAKQTFGINEFGYIVTEGPIFQIDTSTANDGDPIWLGPTGNLIYGLINKPKAPNHLVYLGFVERAHQNQGKVFVRVQNGFEIEELHNVRIVDPQNGDTIRYNSLSGLWINSGADFDISSQLTGISGYFQNQLDNLDLNYASDLQLSQTGITLLNAINQSSGINGSVYIIDINPSGGIGNIGDKVYEDVGGTSSNSILNSCSTTTQNVTVSVLALPGHTRYKPTITLSGQNVTLTALADRPLFTGAAFINLNSGTSLTVRHQDGASHTCTIVQDLPPVVQIAYFTGGYPGSQTELKENDTFNFFIQTNTPITRIEIDNYGAYKAFSANVTPGTSFTITTAQIANRGTSTQNLGARVRVQKANGSFSNWYLTESFGSIDGTHLIKLNNTYPTISTINQANITYPASQAALKDTETAIVNHTVTNANTVAYNSPNGDLSISNPSVYETAKTVQRIGGNYNITTNNFRIVATRTANNAITTSTSTVVYIAHTAPTLSITTPFSRLRSGGNNGTSIQSYNIVITSSQNLISAPSLTPDTNNGGTFSGTGFTGGPTVWTRALQINDNLIKGTKTWASISGTNLAGKIVTTINSGGTYIIGGFVSRTLSLAAFANEVTLNTSVIDFSKMTLSWAVKALPIKAAVGTNVPPPQPDTWTINALNINPTIVRILDTSATNSSSAASNVIVEETV